MTTDHTQWAAARFAHDLYATSVTGAKVEKAEQIASSRNSEGHALCSLSLNAQHRNAAGAVMGGVYCTLADFATAVAMNVADCNDNPTIDMELHWVTTNCNIHFLSQPRGNSLIAEAICRKTGRSTCLYEVSILDGDRTVGIAIMTGTRI